MRYEIPDKVPKDGPYTFKRFPVPSDIPASLRVVRIVSVQRGSVLCQCVKVDSEPLTFDQRTPVP